MMQATRDGMTLERALAHMDGRGRASFEQPAGAYRLGAYRLGAFQGAGASPSPAIHAALASTVNRMRS